MADRVVLESKGGALAPMLSGRHSPREAEAAEAETGKEPSDGNADAGQIQLARIGGGGGNGKGNQEANGLRPGRRCLHPHRPNKVNSAGTALLSGRRGRCRDRSKSSGTSVDEVAVILGEPCGGTGAADPRRRPRHAQRLRHSPRPSKAVKEVWARDADTEAIVTQHLDAHTLKEKLTTRRGARIRRYAPNWTCI